MKTKALFLIPACLIFIFMASMKQAGSAKKYSYLALGDSYTIGEKTPAGENYPNQAAKLLREKGRHIINTTIVAKTGWTTDELEEGIKNAKIKKSYNFVSLLIGVNDQYRGHKVADYMPRFEALLKKAILLAGNDTTHVMVISIPDWSVTPFAEGKDRKKMSMEIDEYNAANKLIADKYKVHYIDITAGTRKAGDDASLLTSDGLHPSGKEYTRWAKEVADYIKEKI